MNGFQLSFFTQQDRRHAGKPVSEWLLELVRKQGIAGATSFAGAEGFGHDRRMHSAHFFELADQPVEIVMTVTADQGEWLFAKLAEEKVHLFFIKTPVEYGTTGDS